MFDSDLSFEVTEKFNPLLNSLNSEMIDSDLILVAFTDTPNMYVNQLN